MNTTKILTMTYLSMPLWGLLFFGCATEGVREKKETEIEVAVPKTVAPQKISPEERQALREWLDVFYDGPKRPAWKEAREKILGLGPEGAEALSIFMLKFFYAGKEKTKAETRSEDMARYWDIAVEELVLLQEKSVPYILYAMSQKGIGSTGRMLCSKTLVQIGPSAVPALLANLSKGNTAFGRSVLETLAKIGDSSAIRPIADLYTDLLRLGSKSTQDLDEDSTFPVRFAAIKALSQLRGADAIPAMEKALEEENDLIVQETIKGLLAYDTPEALPALKKAYKKAQKSSLFGYQKKLQERILLLESVETP